MSPSYPPEPGIPGEPPAQPDLDGFDLVAWTAEGPGSDEAELLERLTDGLAEMNEDLRAEHLGNLMGTAAAIDETYAYTQADEDEDD